MRVDSQKIGLISKNKSQPILSSATTSASRSTFFFFESYACMGNHRSFHKQIVENLIHFWVSLCISAWKLTIFERSCETILQSDKQPCFIPVFDVPIVFWLFALAKWYSSQNGQKDLSRTTFWIIHDYKFARVYKLKSFFFSI